MIVVVWTCWKYVRCRWQEKHGFWLYMAFQLFVTLQIVQTIWCWVLGWLVNNELEWIWNGVGWKLMGSGFITVLTFGWKDCGRSWQTSVKAAECYLWVELRSLAGVLSIWPRCSAYTLCQLYVTWQDWSAGSWTVSSVTLSSHCKPQWLHYFYRCTVHFEDSLIITYQQMH
jgi:hypothetical protein